MNTAYLNSILIYLKQELPENYREQISLTGEKLLILLPDGLNFSAEYEILQKTIESCIQRVRNRQVNIEFTIRSENQERDFKILK